MRKRNQLDSVNFTLNKEDFNLFYSLIFPFFLTVIMMFLFVTFATFYAPKYKWKRWVAFILSTLIALIAFIPGCTLTMTIADFFRYGEFNHDTYEDVNDWRVERYLPEDATNITLIKDGGGFYAKFSIEKNELDHWVKKFHEENREYGQLGNYEEVDLQFAIEDFEYRFDSIQWDAPSDISRYDSIVAGNGAGFSLYYSQSEGMAYERAGYW